MPYDKISEQYYGRFGDYAHVNFDPREVYPWLKVSENLNAFDNLLLIGLLSKTSEKEVGEINIERIINTPGVGEATEGWLRHNFREGLRVYCDLADSIGGAVAGDGIKAMARELAPWLGKAFAASMGMTAAGPVFGIAVGFSFFMLQRGLREWCKRYKTIHYDGMGQYVGGFQSSPLSGRFVFTHKPEISEVVQNRDGYSRSIPSVRISAPADTSVDFYHDHGATDEVTKQILNDLTKNGHHDFTFVDADKGVTVSGEICRIVSHAYNYVGCKVKNFSVSP